MADTAESSSQSPIPEEEQPTPAKKAAKPSIKAIGAKKSLAKPKSHPATSELVLNAIKTLQDRNGSSLQAIKKFIASNYKLDTDKLAPFIKKYLKNAVGSGKLIQTKGKGASGSFKLPATPAVKPVKEKKKKVAKPKTIEKKVGKKEKKKKEKSSVTTAIKTSTEKKKHSSKKETKKSSSASIKSIAPKQKSTKPSPKVASKVKAPKTKKAPSVKKAASGGTEKKAPKTAKTN